MRAILRILFCCLIMTVGTYANLDDKPLAENFAETTLSGKRLILENMRGKVVVLTFWSTKCPICSAEIPKLNKISDKFANREVVFWALTMENEVLVQNYLKKKPFNFTIFPNSLATLLKYAGHDSQGNANIGFPTYFVINQKGEIELKASGWNKTSAVESMIKNLLPN